MSDVSDRGEEEIIDLRGDRSSSGGAEFRINHVEEEPEPMTMGEIQSTPVTRLEEAAMRPHDRVRVKFDKFVNLIATHSYEEVFDKHMDQDVIIGTDLLADLASAREEKNDRKMPMIFLFGILLGILVTWLLLRT